MIKKLLLSLMLVSTASMGHVYAKNNVTLQGKGDAMLTVEQQPAQMPYADPGCVTHVVTFMNGGVILKQYDVCEGEVPVYDGPTPEKAATKEHVYSFDGWDKELQPVGNSDITYNAMFIDSPRKYTIRFYDEDGTTLLSEKEVEYGQFPTYTEPTKPSTPEWEYSFASWDPAMTAVTDDASYRAKYNATKREYIITFLDNDGTTILSAKNWKYGETPTCSVTDKNITGGTVKFNRWEPAVTSVTGIATYTAVRDTVWNTYNVFFFNESAFLTMTMVEHGKTPVYTGPTPTKASDGEYAYEFSGWTPSFTPLTGPGPYFFYATYNAIPLNFTVTFRNYDGTLLKTVDNVAANTPVDGLYTGATPTRPSDDQYHYQFDGWTPAGPATSTNKEFTAKYKAIPRKYGITWKNYDGTTLRVDSLEWHAFPFYSATPTRPDDENYSYKFKSWTPAVSQVVGDAVYTADFEHSGYVIHFVNYNGIELYRKAYVYGETPAYVGPTPTKPKTPEYSYRFNGWIPGIGKVLGPQTYKADFLDIANKYWLQWDPNNGELSGTYTKDSVPYNTPIVSPTITRVGYTFTGWTPLVAATMPAANTTYKATWQPNPNTPYVVEHYRQALDGTYPAALKEVENFTGTTASDVTPAVKSYTGFAAPPTETKAIAADGSTVVVYQYQRQSYTLTWVTDGDALKGTYTKGSVLYEAPITPPDTPTKTGYTFAGWNEAVADKMPATNKTYTAQWNANNYTITFDKQGGTDGSNSVVATYEKPMPSIVKPNRQGYIFDGYFTQPQSLGVMYYNSSVMSMRNWDIPSETTLYAAWRPRDDTPYKVNHYLQNLNNSDYTLYTTENHIGITDKQVTPAVKTYPGFTSPATQTITILPDGSAVVDYKYTRNHYNIQWLTDGDALTGSYTQGSVLYETPIVKPDTPKKTGYTFATWEPDVPLTMPAEDKTFTAKWNPNTNTPYVVKHYRQALDGTYPAALMETENLTGTTAASVTPAVKTYTGFTSPATKTVTIAADGSTEVEYYYTRNKYTLTWVTDGNALTGSYTKGSILFETTITEPITPTKTGYTFAGWDNAVPITMPATDKTFTATWTPNTNTPYVVKHYRQALDGTYPSVLMDTENLTGTTATNVTPVVKTYTGFTSPAPKTVTIAADGSTAVEYYYTRNKYTLTWVTDGNALTGSYTKGSILFETTITEPNTPTKTGYTFAGWDNAVPATMPAGPQTFTATWTPRDDTPYRVEHYLENEVGAYPTPPYEVENLKGTTDAYVTPATKNYDGYIAPATQTKKIAADGSTVFVYQYKRNKFTLAWDANGGDPLTGSYSSGLITFGMAITAPNTPTRMGYHFTQWSPVFTGTMPAGNTTYKAQWEPNTNTPYVVKHYRQALDGTYPSSLMETENLTGTTAASVAPAVKTYTGFTSPAPKTVTILADGSTLVEYYYTRNKYTLTWVTDGNALTGSYTKGSILFETTITEPNTPTKTGYTFAGWDNAVPITMPATDKTFTATWTPNTNTAYVVKHYRQALDGTYPAALMETENLTGTTAASVTPAVKTYTGFTSPATKTVAIAADGSTEVEYYYTRNQYTLTWVTDGNALTGSYTKGSILFETTITEPNTPTKTGYTFAGWDNAVPITMPATDKTFTATWTPNTNTAYVVKHYRQALDGTYPAALMETENLTGTTAANVTPVVKTYTGFTSPAPKTVTILADGSTLVEYYYTRNQYTLTWVTDGDALTGSYTKGGVLYGTSIVAPNTPTKTGYTFAGWNETVPATMPATNKTFTATWDANQYTITLDKQGGTGGTSSVLVTFDQTLPTIIAPTRMGYTFAGYYDAVEGNGTPYYNNSGVGMLTWTTASDGTLYAAWTPNTNTAYVVKHYRQALDGTYPSTLMEVENLTGTTAASVTPAVKTYTGFTSPATKTVTIAADGTTEVAYYYTRNKYFLQWITDGDALTGAYTKDSVLFETTITEPATPIKTGYTFAGWNAPIPPTMPASDKTFTATWTANTNTPYAVHHYQLNLDGSRPATPTEVENLTGTTAATITPAVRTYEGFTSPAPKTVTIAADGSTIVEYEYTRKTYTLTWVTDGDALTGSYTKGGVLYGTSIVAPNTPTKTGYTFAGWNETVPATMPATNKTFTATWDANQYTITLDKQGGTGGTSSVLVTFDQTLPTIIAPTRMGYTFAGYYDAVEGNGTPYYNNSGVGLLSWTTASDGTLYAAWTPNTNTAYVVKHYRQALDGTYPSTLMEVENLTGTTAASVTPAVKTYTGFTSPATKTVTIAADGSTEVVYYYTRNKYFLQWITDGNALTGAYTKDSVLFETPITQPNEPTKTGYLFNGWKGAPVATTMPAQALTYEALWKPDPNTPYAVHHYQLNLDGSRPATPTEIENFTGTTGTSVTPMVKTYEGFTSPSTKTTTILADGSTVVEYEYTRNSYTLSWNANGGTLTGTYTQGTVFFGTPIVAPTPVRVGYTFTGWDTTPVATMPASNLTYTAQWTPNTNTPYVVEHYLPELDGTYTRVDVDSLTGTTGMTVMPDTRIYTGFTPPTKQTMTIAANGSTIVKYYYTRNTNKLSWTTDGDPLTGSYTRGNAVPYETPIVAPNTPIKTGYMFAGWNPSTIPPTMPDNSLSFEATWTPKTNTPYTVEHYLMQVDGTFALVADSVQHFTGTTADIVTPAVLTIEGFTSPAPQALEIFAEGDAVLKYRYTRNQYNLTWIVDGDPLQEPYTHGSVYYQTPIVQPADPTKVGYTFTGWNPAAIPATMPTNNLTFEAQWDANTNTPYTVEHYLMQVDGTYSTTPDSVQHFTGTTAANITPAMITTFEGFSLPVAQTVTIAADGSTVVKYKYPRNKYFLEWITDGDALTGSYSKDWLFFGTKIIQPNTPTKTGYTFNTWLPTVVEYMPSMPTTYTATWTPNPNTPYVVKHYQQQLDGSYLTTPTDVDNLTGTTASSITPLTKDYEGFTAPSPQTTTIAADGSTVVEYYYTRNTYYLAWETDGDALTGTYTYGDVLYGTTILVPDQPTKTGYTFAGWDKPIAPTMPADSTIYTATWTPNPNTPYTVEHYQQLLDGNWPVTPNDVDNLTGTTASIVTPAVKTYEGFTSPDVDTVAIVADGSLTVRYYYLRNTYNLTWTTDGNPLTGTYTQGAVLYGDNIVKPNDPTKVGYTFTGWNPPTIPTTMPAEDLTFNAMFDPNTNTQYVVNHYLQDLDLTHYTLVDSDTLYGTSDAKVTVPVNMYAGFDTIAPVEITIAADGSSVLDYYYNRQTYVLSWDAKGGTLSGTYTTGAVLYQAPIVAPTATRTGYTFAVWAPAFSTIPPTMPHGDVTYGAQWTANHYVVDLDHQGGSSSTNAVVVTYDSLMPPVEVPTKVGYTFAGYYETTKGVGTQYYMQDGSSVHLWNRANDTIIFAHWTPNPNTPYTVEHYQQQLDGTWPTTPEDIDYLTGTTDAYVKPTYKAYEGFTAQDADSAAILADGSLVIRCYYLRNSYNLTWTTDGNPLTGSYTSGATLYGEAIVLPDTPTKVGYTFKAWDKSIPATMPAEDLTFNALFDPNPNTPYIVNHYLQDLDLTHYTLVDIDTLYGTSDAKVTVPVNMYAGFDTIAPVEITIAADGSSVLDYYYNRQTYVLSWDAKGGTLSGTYTTGAVLYQAPIVAPTATRTGYTFAVWAPAFSTIPPTMPHGDVTYEAQWTANKYVVDLDHQGGSSSMSSVLVTYDSIMPAVEVPVLPGYFFKGYYTLPNGQGSQYYLDNGNSLQVWNVEGDTVVYAHWTPDPNTPYVVEHYQQNLDGTTYPTTPTEVDNLSDTTNVQVIPAVRTYEGFTSPEPDTIIVTADTVTVVRYYYERNPYNLTWDANEGTLSGTYDSGVMYYDAPITAPMANRLGYTFNEWLPTFTGNMPAAHTTYVAQWTPNTNTPYTVEHYLQNMDCTTYPTTPFEVDHLTGTTDTKVVPEVKNYPGFTAPEKDSLLVAADGYAILRYYYERNVYPVVFINEEDTLLKLQLPYDSMPHYEGVIPTRDANAQYTYTWNGNWKPMIHPVDGSNDIYHADFDSIVNQYVITFMYDTDTVQVDTLDYGTLPTYQGQPLTKDSTEQWAYQFAGWDPTIVAVTQDTTYYALFDSTLVEYNISFYNYDSTLVLDTLIAYGTMPVCDSIPTKDMTPEWTYLFTGWEPALELVTRDTAYYAIFDSVPTYYQITFLNWNDTILLQDSFMYASIPVCDVIPYKEPDAQYTYTFAGWDPAIVPVEQDTVYKALFDSIINEYLITFVCDGDTLQADSLAYGTMPEYVGETPTRDSTAQYSFTFVGWTPQVDTVRMDMMYEATFDSTLNQYQITFVNWNDTILQQSMWNYGDMPFYNGIPVKDTTAHFNYQFAGWEPIIEPVICDTIYKAVFDSVINPDECYCDSAPAVELYDWFLILDVNSLYAMGYTFSAEDVTWYRVTGAEPDTMGTPAYDRKDEIVGRGFHFTPETPLVGTGSYYAEITLPKQIADVLCQDFMRTRIFTFTNTRLLLAPSIVYPHESLHLYGLPEGIESTLHIYDATGKLVDVMKTTASHISWTTPVTGTYMILVQSQDIHEVLKYIVK